MKNGVVSGRDKELEQEILLMIKTREGTFGNVLVTTALAFQNNAWKNILTRFVILPKEDVTNYDRTLVYPRFELRQSTIQLQQFVSIFDDILLKGKLAIPNGRQADIEGDLQIYHSGSIGYGYLHPSDEVFLSFGWPSNAYQLMAAQQFQMSPPGEPLIAIDQPLFDNANSALSAIFGPGSRNFSYPSSILFVVPNYSAKIAQIKVGSNELQISIQTKSLNSNQVTAKVYCEAVGRVFQAQVDFKDNEARVSLEFPPDSYMIFLLSKTGEALDHRTINLRWSSIPEGVVVEKTPESIEQIINRGESRGIEFKRAIPKNWQDFAETVVAMSNGTGGIILLGVDDDASILGYEDPKVTDTIHDLLRDYCEPPVEPNISTQVVQNKTVVIVEIKEGTKKPYLLKGKGVFVRVGATDRIATRDELLSLIATPGLGYLR